MIQIIVLAHNIRSTHNVGSILRTSEGFGVKQVVFSGYTPYPKLQNDPRLPHIADKLTKQIHKTALGAESIVPFEITDDIMAKISELKQSDYKIVALEQAKNSINLNDYKPSGKLALLLGEEVHGIEPKLVSTCDDIVEIPMSGQKESFNVSVATGIALYQLSV